MSAPVRPIAADRDAWDKQPGESTKAYAAFVAYRDLGSERSHARVAGAISRARSQISGWASTWQWSHRVDAWEQQEEQRRREITRDARDRMTERHATQASAAQQAAMGPVIKFLERLRDKPQELDDAETKDLADLALKSLRSLGHLQAAERIARGLPGTSTEIVGDPARPLVQRGAPHPDLSRLSILELEVLDWLHCKAAGGDASDVDKWSERNLAQQVARILDGAH